MKAILFLSILLFPLSISCQITIEPQLFVGVSQIRIDNEPNILISNLEHKNALQYGLGVEVSAPLSNKYSLSIQSNFSQVNYQGTYDLPNFAGVLPTFDPFEYLVHRWDNGFYVSYEVLENVVFGIGGHAVYSPSVFGSFFGRGSLSYHATEFGLGGRVKFSIKKITLAMEYYNGLSQKRANDSFFTSPLQTFGLKLGYPIVLNKK